jgi:hypothetical protein
MIINATNETIEIVLAANVATSQASFMCFYNKANSNTLTPIETNGNTNNTTAVTLVGSPSSNEQHQVRNIIIENNDTASITVTIRYNNTSVTRTIFKATILTGQNLFYTAEKGWVVLDNTGNEVMDNIHINPIGNISFPEFYAVNSAVSTSNPSTAGVFFCLGRSTKNNPTVNLRYEVTTQLNNPTWAEIGLYIISIGQSINNQNQWERVSTLNASAVWNTTGFKTSSIATTNVVEGDVIYPFFASVATTTAAFRGSGVVDQTFTGFQAVVTSVSSWRPTTQFYLISSNYTNVAAGIRAIYQLT